MWWDTTQSFVSKYWVSNFRYVLFCPKASNIRKLMNIPWGLSRSVRSSSRRPRFLWSTTSTDSRLWMDKRVFKRMLMSLVNANQAVPFNVPEKVGIKKRFQKLATEADLKVQRAS
jgi:hypothetical protein